jgi:hypothetical protein
MRVGSGLSCCMHLLLLMSAALAANCHRTEPNTNDIDSGPISDLPDDIECQGDYQARAAVDDSPIKTHRLEDPAAVERLISLGCWFTELNGVHTFMGYPPAYEDGQMSDDDFRLVKKLPNLLNLQLCRGYKQRFGLTADAFLHLRQHPELRTVAIRGTAANLSFDDSLFDHLAEIPRLAKLSIIECRLEGDSLQKIGRVKGLKSLSLSSSRFEYEDWSALGQLDKLEVLNLQLCAVGDDELRFVSSLKNLRVLQLYGNGRITRKSLPMLQKLPQLESLLLTHTGVYPVTLDDVAAFPTLRELNLLDVQPDFSSKEVEARFPGLAFSVDD